MGGICLIFAYLKPLFDPSLCLTMFQAGVKNCFVNLGSDHPSIIEAIVKGRKERPDQFPSIYACPSEVRIETLPSGLV
jgi:hypothetical protein